jgi:hypothetical protein
MGRACASRRVLYPGSGADSREAVPAPGLLTGMTPRSDRFRDALANACEGALYFMQHSIEPLQTPRADDNRAPSEAASGYKSG